MDKNVYQKRRKNLESRLIGVLAIFAQLIYIYAIVKGFNSDYPVISSIFIGFQLIAFLCFILYVFNNWTIKVPGRKVLKEGYEQKVAVIIPTWSEPVSMVKSTVLSVINQDYPIEKLLIVVSDDSRNPEMLRMVYEVATENSKLEILYNNPPTKGSIFRQGEAKSGNLNSAFRLIQDKYPDIEYIETRDADDLVGSKEFLRDTVGQLMSDSSLAYVQTVKKLISSSGDPFGNKEEVFFKSLMLYKNGANAAFPCGSGLVWKKTALLDIGGFPEWNLVEDFQSGAEALRKGWHSMYLPITGAVGQTSPEDIPNMYKQRGTWAMDSFRFFFWGNKKGLNLRQRLHFAESAINYMLSIGTYFYAFLPAVLLVFRILPVRFTDFEFGLLQITQILSVIVFTMCLAGRGDISIGAVMKSTQTLLGNFPVLLKSLVLTIVYGPNRKPNYKVTRKKNKQGIYILYVLPQILLVGVLIASIIINVKESTSVANIDASNILWALYFIYIYKQVILNSVFKWTNMFRKNTDELQHPRYEPKLLMRLKQG
ncbi:MAG: glycosyltransferase [Candidatus Dojkabacteria bacterium]